MQARINNPALSVPGALDGLREFGMAARNADVPEETLALIQLRVSQINGCSVCADMHSRELEYPRNQRRAAAHARRVARDALLQ